jgi:hypothetical protein
MAWDDTHLESMLPMISPTPFSLPPSMMPPPTQKDVLGNMHNTQQCSCSLSSQEGHYGKWGDQGRGHR